MVDKGDRVVEFPEAGVLNLVTREDVNEVTSSLRSSLAIEVKSMLKDFLEGLRLPTDPLHVVNRKPSELKANSKKENGSSDKNKLCQGTSEGYLCLGSSSPGLWRTGSPTAYY